MNLQKIISFIVAGVLLTVSGIFGTRLFAKWLDSQQGVTLVMDNFLDMIKTLDFWKIAGASGASLGVTLFALRSVLRRLLVIAGIGICFYAYNGDSKEVYSATLLFPFAAAAVTNNQQNYVPKYLVISAAAIPNSLRVNVPGVGLICDLDSTGITEVSKIKKIGTLANTYVIPLADGCKVNTTCEITIDAPAGGAGTVYGNSDDIATAYIQNLRQTILQNSTVNLTKFFWACMPAAAANDVIDIAFTSGFIQKFDAVELQALSVYNQEDASVMFWNYEQEIQGITITPVAQRTVYYQKALPLV